MSQTFYRRRNKLKPEDWTEEIERWERHYMNDWYEITKRREAYEFELREKEAEERRMLAFPLFQWEREKREKEELLDNNGNYCGHKKKVEIDGYLWCWDCGIQTGRCYGSSVGYKNKNHVMRGRRKPKASSGRRP